MDPEQFEEFIRRMDTLIRLTAMNSLAGKSLSDQVAMLSAFGLKPREVASILAKPINVVTATVSYLQKKKGKKR